MLARNRRAADYRAMDQVSRPMLIALAATVVLAALWLVALRPKPVDVAETPAAPVQAVAKAKNASAASDAANARTQAATGGSAIVTPAAGTAQSPATPAPQSALADAKPANRREAAVLRDIKRGKVVVMLFWNAKASDDLATRRVVRDLDRRGGKVAVHVIPISRVGQYESITDGVSVSQSPTTLVIDRKRRTRSIVGLTERGELKQAVGDALAGRR